MSKYQNWINVSLITLFVLICCHSQGQQCQCPKEFSIQRAFVDNIKPEVSTKYILCVESDNDVVKPKVYYNYRDFSIVLCETEEQLVFTNKGYSYKVFVENDELIIEKIFTWVPSLKIPKDRYRQKELKIVYIYVNKVPNIRIENGDFMKLNNESIEEICQSFYSEIKKLKSEKNYTFDFSDHLNKLAICALNKDEEAKKIIMTMEHYLDNPSGTIDPPNNLRSMILRNTQEFIIEYNALRPGTNE